VQGAFHRYGGGGKHRHHASPSSPRNLADKLATAAP
jgi:hypothetical protein